MKIFGMTDKGTHRAENQDYFRVSVLSPPPRIKGARKKEDSALLAVVCDGIGGAKGGATASRLAVECLTEEMKKPTSRDAVGALTHALSVTNRSLYDTAKRDEALRGMGTTMVAALTYENALAILNVGDSRIYLWHAGHVLQLTHDHSYVQEMLDAGKMSAAEARRSAYKNLITRAVGTLARVEGDISYCYWEEGDKLLLCTDGLADVVEEREISSILSEDVPIDRAVRELIEAAVTGGCHDNITALLLVNTKENQ